MPALLTAALPGSSAWKRPLIKTENVYGPCRIAGVAEPVFFHVSEVQADAEQAADKTSPAAATPAAAAGPPEGESDAGGQAAAAPAEAQQQQPDGAEVPADSPAEEGAAEQEPKQDAERGKQQKELRAPVDLSSLLQPGDPVEFTVAASSHDGVRHRGNRAPRMMAKQVAGGCYPCHRLLLVCSAGVASLRVTSCMEACSVSDPAPVTSGLCWRCQC